MEPPRGRVEARSSRNANAPLREERKGAGGVNGADRDRTDNLLDATEALSQLSYGPAWSGLATGVGSISNRLLGGQHPRSGGIGGVEPLSSLPGVRIMSATATLTLYSVVILLVSVAGGLVPSFIRLTHRRMQLALCLVSGVMLGVGMLHMLGHAAEAVVHAHGDGVSMHAVMLAAVVGFLVMFLLERFFCFHHHESPEEGDPHTQHRLGWIGAFVGLTVHTLLAGIALAAAVYSGTDPVPVDGPPPASVASGLAGFGVFLGIILHKPFDAFTIVALMRRSDRPRLAIHVVNGIFALVIPLGVLLFIAGADLASDVATFTTLALAFSAGTFICIAASDVLPELQFHEHDRVAMSVMLVLGLAIAWGSGLLEEGGHHHHHHGSPVGLEPAGPPRPSP